MDWVTISVENTIIDKDFVDTHHPTVPSLNTDPKRQNIYTHFDDWLKLHFLIITQSKNIVDELFVNFKTTSFIS